ncbi:MAG: hypothetical protein HY290_19895 [Planctomycetia bacterium]|nr:hypothetical protein [Planctomycetia bacterium]
MPTPSPVRVVRYTKLFAAGLAIAGLLGSVLSFSPALAQSGKGKGQPKGSRGSAGYGPGQGSSGAGIPGVGSSMPPGGASSRMPPGTPGGAGGFSGKKAGDKKGGPAVRPKPGEGTAEEYDNESLPRGYQVPQEPPEAFNTDEEWIEDPTKLPADAKKADKDRAVRLLNNSFKSVMTAGEFTKDSDKQLVVDMVRYKLAQLTQKEFREKAAELRIKLEQEIEASNNKTGPRAARLLALKTIADEAPRLFQYHFVARLQGAILLAHLADFNETEADAKKPAVPCSKAAEALVAMVNDEQQLTAVRVWGVNGLVRLATLDNISFQLRSRLVDVLVAQMNASGKQHEWFQLRLAEGLGRLSVIQNQDKRPVVPQALALVLADSTRPWLVRAEAAQSLGRLQYDGAPSVNVSLLAYEMARLTQQIMEAYNKAPKQTVWKLCMIRIYGGFKPLEDEDTSKDKTPPKRGLVTQVEGKPGLSSHRKAVQGAFEKVLPLVSKVVGEPKEIDPALADLKKWLEDKDNRPENYKIHPDEAPIISQSNAGGRDPAGEGVAAGTANGR